METSHIPTEIQAAREELARKSLEPDFTLNVAELRAAWILIDSAWRLKLGGAATCAVCKRRCGRGRRDTCLAHDACRYLFRHTSILPEDEDRDLMSSQLHSIAGLPFPKTGKPQ